MVNEINFKKEYYLHNVTQKHLKELFGLEFVASEIQLNNLRFDTLAFCEKTNCFVIIEYKNTFNENVLNQTREYYDLLLSEKEFYVDRYNERFENDQKYDFNFDESKVMIIGPEFSQYQVDEIKKYNNFELWKVTLYDDYRVLYKNMQTGKIEEIEITPDDLKITEDNLLEDKSSEMKEFYHELKSKVCGEFDDLKINYLVDALSFKVNGKLICVVNFLKSSFSILYYTDYLENADNAEKLSDNYGNANYKLKIKSYDEINYFFELFKQVYNQKV